MGNGSSVYTPTPPLPPPTSEGGDKVNMLTSILTYIYILTESLKGDLQAICNHQADCPFYLWPDI